MSLFEDLLSFVMRDGPDRNSDVHEADGNHHAADDQPFDGDLVDCDHAEVEEDAEADVVEVHSRGVVQDADGDGKANQILQVVADGID